VVSKLVKFHQAYDPTQVGLYGRLRFYGGNCRRAVTPWRQRVISPAEATTLFACSFGDDGWHHLRETLKEYDADPSISYRDTTLWRYLTEFQPGSSCGLTEVVPPDRSAPPLFVYPWGTFWKRKAVSAKNLWTSRFCGRSAEEFVSAEFARTIELYRMLKQTRYRPWRYGFVGGTFLRRASGEQRLVVLQGNHRLAVFAHVGVTDIAVRDCRRHLVVVDEADAERWPLVVDGTFNVASALAIFNLFFEQKGFHVLRRLRLVRS
jgi:hypothetical protein